MSMFLGAVCLSVATAWAGSPMFSDATASSGIDYKNLCGAKPGSKGWITEAMGAGAAWLDYDNDGNLDLYVVNGSSYDRAAGAGEPNRLYRGDGKGGFKDVTMAAGVGHRGWGYGVTVGDIDNDGDSDIYVTNLGANVLYRNEGNGTFKDISAAAGVDHGAWSTSAALFDLDNDGDLDLYVANYMACDTKTVPRRGTEAAIPANCNYKGIPVYCGPLGQVPVQDVLYRNDGKGSFTDITREAGVLLKMPRFALGVVAADYDNDGDQDLYIANDSVQNSLWNNDGGKLKDVGVRTLAALNMDGRAQAGMGTDFGDYTGDGFLDIVVTNFAHDLNTVYKSMKGKLFIDDSTRAGMGVTSMALSWGAGFHDFDNDSDTDLFIANGHIYPQVDAFDIGTRYRQRNHLFVNTGPGDGTRLVESSQSSGEGLAIERPFRGAAFGDYDNDGDVDIFVTAVDEAGLLLRNDTASPGHRLQVRLEGTTSNRDGVGARVSVTAGGKTWVRHRKGGGSYLSASDPRLHFGLGGASKVEVLEVRWPSGKTSVLKDIQADRLVTVREGE
jgi:hypothetical protein